MNQPISFLLWKSDHYRVEHIQHCRIPGYLIVCPNRAVKSLAELDADTRSQLGYVLSRVYTVVKETLHPIQIYTVSFGEENTDLHFHVFPRTAEITTQFLASHSDNKELINGPVLLDWARMEFKASPAETWNMVAATVARLKERLN